MQSLSQCNGDIGFSLQVNYWPSTQDNVQTSPNSKEAQTISSATVTGQRVKQVRKPTAASFSPWYFVCLEAVLAVLAALKEPTTGDFMHAGHS